MRVIMLCLLLVAGGCDTGLEPSSPDDICIDIEAVTCTPSPPPPDEPVCTARQAILHECPGT
jgi:hypothetical protein